MSLTLANPIELPALRHLRRHEAGRADLLRHLASGVRVDRGRDGPADLISGTKLRAERAATAANLDNADAAVAAGAVAERALSEVSDHLNRLEQLVVASSDDAVSRGEREANQIEIDSLLKRVQDVLHGAEFKGTPLFRGRPPETALPPPEGIYAEVGSVTAGQPVAGATTRVNFVNPIPGAAVVVGPLTNNDTSYANVRVTGYDDLGFDYVIQEQSNTPTGLLTPDRYDGVHGVETFGWFAAPAGAHTLPDGTKLELGTVNRDHNWGYINFAHSFTAEPTVVSAVTSNNDSDLVAIRHENLDPTRIRVKLQEQEAILGGRAHANEQVTYLAVEPVNATGQTQINEGGTVLHAANTPDHLSHVWRTHASPGFAAPVVLAGMITEDGGDAAMTRIRNNVPGSVDLLVQEEQSANLETNHTSERGGVVTFANPGPIEPFQPAPPPSADDLAGTLSGDPTSVQQSSLVFDLGDGKRFGLAALRFEDTSLAKLGDPDDPLAALATGLSLSIGGERPTAAVAQRAQATIGLARDQVLTMRGRAARFGRWVIDPQARNLSNQAVHLAAAESQTLDADVAQATAELTRLDVLRRSTSDVLRTAGRQREQAVLGLLAA